MPAGYEPPVHHLEHTFAANGGGRLSGDGGRGRIILVSTTGTGESCLHIAVASRDKHRST